MRRRPLAVILALVLAPMGCGTLYNNEISPCPKTQSDTFRPLGGVRKDVEFAGANAQRTMNADLPANERIWAAVGMVAYLGADLPLCLVGDALLLPLTINGIMNKRDSNVDQMPTP